MTFTPADAEKLTGAVDLMITGINQSSEPSIVVLRLDDKEKAPYHDRVNLERVVPPGKFTLNQLLGGLETPGKRPLIIHQLKQIIVFAADPDTVRLTGAKLVQHPPLPDGSVGWDLGPKGSALWPGFQPLPPFNTMLRGKHMRAIDRGGKMQASEGLTTDGIQGLEGIKLPLAAGPWAITLWLRDPGEWEYLPPVYQRQITVNGTLVSSLNLSADDWVEQVYIGRQWPEAKPADSGYIRYADGPNSKVTFLVYSQGQGIDIVISGNMPHAGYVSAILAEPAKDRQILMTTQVEDASGLPVLAQVEKGREFWWNNNWPLSESFKVTKPPVNNKLNGIEWLEKPPQKVAPGSWFSASFRLPAELSLLDLQVTTPTSGKRALPVQLRYGHWRWQRSALKSTLLRASDTYLKSGLPPSKNHPGGRKIHLRVKVPQSAPGGTYTGNIEVVSNKGRVELPLQVDVMDSPLPDVTQTIGVYLEHQVQYGWFKQTQALSQAALECDLKFLRGQGLTSVAPPLPTPSDPQGIIAMVDAITTLRRNGFDAPVLAYTPLKRLIAAMGVDQAATVIANLSRELSSKQLPEPVWVSADEPSNADSINDLEASFRYVKAFSPQSRLAGHLNNSGDRKWLSKFDLLLLNDGFGIDKDQLASIPSSNEVWLYNLSPRRHAAGFYLWQTGAEGLMLWHARMPTADPFNPTDGRESDIQFLYPSVSPCPLQHDVDQGLFELTDGINDLQWLTWLEQRAKSDSQAGKLLRQLRKQVPDNWEEMSRVPVSTLNKWRDRIIALSIKSERKTASQIANMAPQQE
ncbi:hypothetical protein L2725_09610 [Shewanella corallii]|uniref:Glycoside hydrolase 123 C-terminal domain-containing protein n=1 Tax=Shewanella corallii TaxID=560080 RepID=A0ABT0N6L2_9GAMM|nr:hypothetical protein [Shewanella corallii]MCL2914044.1 hypothetical protein [Shewanella corallii]